VWMRCGRFLVLPLRSRAKSQLLCVDGVWQVPCFTSTLTS